MHEQGEKWVRSWGLMTNRACGGRPGMEGGLTEISVAA
jgi:hypothetical protein